MKKYFLLATVFMTGAAVLMLEVIATRVLSPFFGNTIFTVSSVLGVILAALSIGYSYGGRLIDRVPSPKLFFGAIFLAGVSVLFSQHLSTILLPLIGKLPITIGPLVASLTLFFIPNIFLGALSPFAIKLQERDSSHNNIGSISGSIFFWSTAGSICGSLLAGFVLIPHFGITRIMVGIGTVLALYGLAPFAHHKKDRPLAAGLALCVLIATAMLLSSQKNPNVIFSQDGVYEKLTIADASYQGKPTRFFLQDKSFSGAMFRDNNDLVFDYTKYFSLYKLFAPNIKNALVIGGGAYSVPKALLADSPTTTIDVAEIEPSLFALSKKYFNVPNDPRLVSYIEDGRRLLATTEKKYDLMFSDVYFSLYSLPVQFTTQEFFRLAKTRLRPDGVFMANIIGSLSRQQPSLLFSEMKTFRAVFPNSYFFAVDSPRIATAQNIIFIGANGDKKIDLRTNPFATKQINLDRFDLAPYSILTDDFSPVEYLVATDIQRSVQQKNGTTGNQPRGAEMIAIIAQQLGYGPRFLSASGHKKMQTFLQAEMSALTPTVVTQRVDSTLTNIIARFFPENPRRLILATHYDSKKFAENDAQNPNLPVPGANDSASGVAVLIEVARTLSQMPPTPQKPSVGVDIIFFDGEEGIENLQNNYRDWRPLGSTYFAKNLATLYPKNNPPLGAIVLDMVCDASLDIRQEPSSLALAKNQIATFWNIGRRLDPSAFIAASGPAIADDHTPLIAAGIPSFLVIDTTYPSFHTTTDTLDKCSTKSLKTIAQTVLQYIAQMSPAPSP